MNGVNTATATLPQSQPVDPEKRDKFNWPLFGRVVISGATFLGGLFGFVGRGTPASSVACAVVGAVLCFGASTIGVRAVRSGALSMDGWSKEKAKDIWKFKFADTVKETVQKVKDVFTKPTWNPPNDVHTAARFKEVFGKANAAPIQLDQDNALCGGKLEGVPNIELAPAQQGGAVPGKVVIAPVPDAAEGMRYARVDWDPSTPEKKQFQATATLTTPGATAEAAPVTEKITFSVIRPPIGTLGQAREWAWVNAVIAPFAGGDDVARITAQLRIAKNGLHADHPYRSKLDTALQALAQPAADAEARKALVASALAPLQALPKLPFVELSQNELQLELDALKSVNSPIHDKVVKTAEAALTAQVAATTLTDAAKKLETQAPVHPLRFALQEEAKLLGTAGQNGVSALQQVDWALSERRVINNQALMAMEASTTLRTLTSAAIDPAKELLVYTATADSLPATLLTKTERAQLTLDVIKAELEQLNPGLNIAAMRIDTTDAKKPLLYVKVAAKPQAQA